MSSKAPPTELLEKPKTVPEDFEEEPAKKRYPGCQPSHLGKKRKGFGWVDRYEILRLQQCCQCGSINFIKELLRIQRQQVAQLVKRPIEVLECKRYHYHCQCAEC